MRASGLKRHITHRVQCYYELRENAWRLNLGRFMTEMGFLMTLCERRVT